MKEVEMVASQAIRIGGKAIAKGETFKIDGKYAQALVAVGRASVPTQRATMKTKPEPAPTPKPEPTPEPTPEPEEDDDGEEESTRSRRRRYRRTDMQPE
jgi:hypothetical protein